MVEELHKGWRKASAEDGGVSLDKRSRRTRPRPPLTFKVGSQVDPVSTESTNAAELTTSDFQHLIHISSASIACFNFETPIRCDLASSEFTRSIYSTRSYCLEGNHRFARAVGEEHLERIRGRSVSDLLPDVLGYEELFQEWHLRSLSGAGFEIELLDLMGRPLTHHAAMYGHIDNELLYRFWIILRDITPFTRAVRALGRNENHYHSLLNSPGVLLIRVLPDGTIDYASEEARRLLRIAPGRLRSIEEVLTTISAPTDSPSLQQLAAHRASGDITPFTLSLRLKNSANRSISYTLRQVAHISATGELDYFDLFGYPDAEKTSTEASGIIHDLNNQLMVIQGQLDLALNEQTKAGQVDHLTRALSSARVASAMTAQTLGRARHDQHSRQNISANELLSSMRTLLRPLLPAETELVAIPCPSDLVLTGHLHALHQIITNLVINARDAIVGNGQIILSARPSNQHVEISVRDNGPGIPAETLKKIFTPYFTTKSPSRGTGLGLSMVKSLVEEGGGHISVSSSAGAGTLFSFTVPQAVSESVEETESIDPSLATSHRLSILVADDETAVRDTIISALTHRGHSVTSASDRKTLLKHLECGGVKHDLIIIDNGIRTGPPDDLLTTIRKIAPATPILVTSGDPSCAPALGVNHSPLAFIAKPFGLQELYMRINALVPAI